ncbi:MAG TPA: exodeoxyribonuclease VII large subunit [Nocardioidaceae bacterium]|nr:exodeoxyribonuclease VII large subunit [Nocardioidaceae bacterium]
MALQTSLDKPVPVRTVANALHGWIDRLGWIWVEGQITQLMRRPGTQTVFLTLRDPVAEVSVQVTCPRRVFDVVDPPVTEGAGVVAHVRPQYYIPRGSLNLAADDIRPVGLGELLARIERRRRLLAAEGLFDPARKRPLPFLPRRVGLICGRNSAAERDVVENAKRRWPAVAFTVENVPVQGPSAARDVIEAVQRLDKAAEVDVIVISRGGGSVEDLLAFSDEGLLRAVAASRTPVVSAIGHEQDTPLLDLVADHRASTPTDAGKLVVPDMAEEMQRTSALRARTRQAVVAFVDREQRNLATVLNRPVIAEPQAVVERRAEEVNALVARTRRCVSQGLDRAGDDIEHRLARLRTLSPLATLQRGYAVLQAPDGAIVCDPASVHPGDRLTARVARGQLGVRVEDTTIEGART